MNNDQFDKQPTILLGYVVMRNSRINVGTPTLNGTVWQQMESGFKPDFVKKRLYTSKPCADDAAVQMKKNDPDDDFEVHPVYWYGR